jgi:lipopolysaccharide export LptBFGC system permease protein LptF
MVDCMLEYLGIVDIIDTNIAMYMLCGLTLILLYYCFAGFFIKETFLKKLKIFCVHLLTSILVFLLCYIPICLAGKCAV